MASQEGSDSSAPRHLQQQRNVGGLIGTQHDAANPIEFAADESARLSQAPNTTDDIAQNEVTPTPVPPQYSRGAVDLFGGSNQGRRDDLTSEVGYFGKDGPSPYSNGLPCSEQFLSKQQDLAKIRREIEADFTDEKMKQLRKEVTKAVTRQLSHGKFLDAQELGRQEFERQKKRLRAQIEAELRPKIERELALKIRAELESERERGRSEDDARSGKRARVES